MRLTPLLLFAAFALPGPGEAQTAPKVVESKAPQWTRRTAWSVEPKHTLQIGMVDGAQPYLFDRIVDVTRFDDGRIAVATLGSNDIRFFDATGRYLKSAGGKGEGPREFTSIGAIKRGRGDSLFVRDYMLGTKVFTPTGEYVRLISGRREPPTVDYVGAFDDGTALAITFPQGERSKQRAGTWVENSEVYVLPSDGGPKKKIAELPGAEFAAKRNEIFYVQLRMTLLTAVGSHRFYHHFGDAFRITEYDMNGRPTRILVRPWTPLPVRQSDIDAFRENMVNGADGAVASPEQRAARDKYFETLTFAKTHPVSNGLKVDTEGNLWVRHYENQKFSGASLGGSHVPLTPTRWTVFDATTGAWLGEIETPPRFNVMEIGQDYIAGMARDELDVEYVRIYRLIKPR